MKIFHVVLELDNHAQRYHLISGTPAEDDDKTQHRPLSDLCHLHPLEHNQSSISDLKFGRRQKTNSPRCTMRLPSVCLSLVVRPVITLAASCIWVALKVGDAAALDDNASIQPQITLLPLIELCNYPGKLFYIFCYFVSINLIGNKISSEILPPVYYLLFCFSKLNWK